MVYILAGSLFLLVVRPYEHFYFLGDLHVQRFYLIFTLIAFAAYSRKKIKMDSIVVLYFMFMAIIWICTFLGINFDTSYNTAYTYTTESLPFIIMIFTLYDEHDYVKIIEFMLLVTVLYVLLSFREYLGGRFQYSMGIKRMLGYDITYGQPNSFSTSIVLTYPMLWLLLKTKYISKKIRYLLYLYAPISFFCLFSTGSRGGFVQCIAFVVLLFWKSKRKFLYVILALIALFIVWHSIPETLQNRYYSLIDPSVAPNAKSAEQSAQGRIVGLLHGIEVWKQHPLFGVGPGNLIYTWPGEAIGHQAHNLVGQLLSDLGIFGFLIFVSLVSLCYFRSNWIVKTGRRLSERFSQYSELENEARMMDFVSRTGEAIKQLIAILFVAGLTGHNMLRYHWVYAIYLTVVGTWLIHKYLNMNFEFNEPEQVEADTGPSYRTRKVSGAY